MTDRKKIIREYKNTGLPKGVYGIRNKQSGRIFLAGSLNIYNIVERMRFRLNGGSHVNEELQKDWKRLGEDAFSIQIMETLPLKDDRAYDYDEDLKILEIIWTDKFGPLSEHCYNKKDDIRLV